MSVSVSIIIVAYKSRNQIQKCLDHIRCSQFKGTVQTIIVNNSGSDGLGAYIAEHYPEIDFYEPETNLGFGVGCNYGMERAKGDVYLLLNPDAYIDEHAIQIAYDYLSRQPTVAVVGAQFYNDEGVYQESARMFPTILDKIFMLTGLAARYPRSRIFGHKDLTWWDHKQPRRVDWVIGAFLMMDVKVCKKLKGFDPMFFLYSEEWDYCKRVHNLGYEVHYHPQVCVVHSAGASSANEPEAYRQNLQLQWLRIMSEAMYYRKHWGWLGVVTMLGMEGCWSWLRWLKHRNNPQKKQLAIVHERNFKLIRQAVRVTHYGKHSPSPPWHPDSKYYDDYSAR